MTKRNSPELMFAIEGAQVIRHAISPSMALNLRISSKEPAAIHSILLRAQIHIEAPRRRYVATEQSKLFDLFGPTPDWGRTLRSLFWNRSEVSVPGFTDSILVPLPVACHYDFNLAAVKYFDAIEQGTVPLCLLFSGTVFYSADGFPLQIAQISWDKETTYPLPIEVWREVIQHYYPNLANVFLRKDVFDRLLEYKRNHGLPTWEQAIENLLASIETSQETVSQ